MIPKPITSRDVDDRIEHIGIRLGPDQDRLRARVLAELQLERARQTDWENSRPSVPMFLLDKL